MILSPYLHKKEKVLLLQTIQKLFWEENTTFNEFKMTESELADLIVVAKSVYGERLSFINDSPKIDKAAEMYKSCTFKP